MTEKPEVSIMNRRGEGRQHFPREEKSRLERVKKEMTFPMTKN